MKSGNMNAIDVYDYFRRFSSRPKTFYVLSYVNIKLEARIPRGGVHIGSLPQGTAGVSVLTSLREQEDGVETSARAQVVECPIRLFRS